ncbi:hypothetical protein QRO11_13860 [Paracidovorax citrulli]|uniref:DUF1240 domain-containing protein n=3 Tax=Paracidovorax citrulli TaxID=80869 RepID=A1TS88_PARC0|nr:hypothetical protein [Paracidovorax citrulli]ABM33826.1 hypothetical protein Aave_3265 [Paracidovorax citrulli AAC00-1]PVY63262.1 hypothetical protein C8E08_0540 [Paracidovorax citrulli]REG67763.1 hypothetical protein C8E07_0847 [Paracidovorax citrulli]UEG44573.1 hypothetical protein LKW27_12920 [Paracidovorax citrulli]UMT83731.1 hypothetical protein FRC75_10310 [Paracidovorax citrulli]
MPEHIDRQELLKIRKAMVIGLPSIVFVIFLCCFFVLPEVFRSINDLLNDSPVVRISVAGSSVFFALPLALIMLVLAASKAIPIKWNGADFFVRLLNINIFVAGAFMVIGMPALTLAQYHYLPTLGYSKCNELRGHPTMWFNDWVKNPEWCVHGKDRAWVMEQAQKGTSQ